MAGGWGPALAAAASVSAGCSACCCGRPAGGGRARVPLRAVAGFGLGGLIGLLLLAPVGLWRAWRRRADRRGATGERADPPDGTGLWHTADAERDAAPVAAAGTPGRAVIEAPEAEENQPERPEEREARRVL